MKSWETILQNHSGEILILVIFLVLMISLIILVPQLIRSHLKRMEMKHRENMKALENGFEVPPQDNSSLLAGRTSLLVPMVVIISAGTVTCFMAANKYNDIFAVSLAVWTVAGVVSLAAITGGVALIGRLAQMKSGETEESPENPLDQT